MASLRIHKLASMLVAVAVASASLLVAAEPANAASALFKAKRIWWFSQAGTWTDGLLSPRTTTYNGYAHAWIGATTPTPSFAVPQSFIKNTTYTFMCGPGTFMCYIGYPKSSGWYSYWNAKGSFRPNNPYAPTTTTTVRARTVYDQYDPTLNGWPTKTTIIPTEMGKASRTVTVATPPPTAMYTRVTPTEGGCTGTDCPGTTQFGGKYTASRAGSIMVWPGSNRFGGTMRFFDGPNGRDYQLITIDGPYTSVSWPRTPTSQQAAATKGEITIGSITASVVPGKRFRLTEPDHINRLITGTSPNGGACTAVTAPPNGTGMCAYYVKYARYLITRVPYTTGMFQAWHPVGNTNTIQTSTGYDNRTAAGLNGTISLVHPRLVHAYLSHPSANPPKEIRASWGSARSRKINFMFAPEPAGVAMLAAGVATLAGLYRLRRR